VIQDWCPSSLTNSLPVEASQTRAVLPTETVTIREPSGENAALWNGAVALSSLNTSFPVETSHTWAVLKEAVSMREPSRENAALPTPASNASSLSNTFPVEASHTRAVLSSDAGHDSRAVRREGRAIDPVQMAVEFKQHLSRGGVPHPSRIVIRGCGYSRPILGEGDT